MAGKSQIRTKSEVHSRKRKSKEKHKVGARKRRQLVMQPKVVVEPIPSDASTLPYNLSGDVIDTDLDETYINSLGDFSVGDLEEAGGVDSDCSGDSLLGAVEDRFDQNAPLRDDMPIVRERWNDNEVNALMDSINVNREALKFNFDGPGGGKDVKRQGWKDVAKYVNSSCNSHRTIKQCRDKTDDYTGRVKKKFDRLRYLIQRTGNGAIRDGLKIKGTEAKALDYLREEAVRGIPGVEPMQICPYKEKPSEQNLVLLWKEEREDKPDYNSIKMERQGVPKHYKDKNKRRLEREKKAKTKEEHKIAMKAERKAERVQAKREKRMLKKLKKERNKERREQRELISKKKAERRREKEALEKAKEEEETKGQNLSCIYHKDPTSSKETLKKKKYEGERKAAREVRKKKKERRRNKKLIPSAKEGPK